MNYENNEFQVYRAWSEDAVRQALTDFKHEMYDGAGIAELQAGLRCMDYLTKKTALPPDLVEDLESTALQADMRVELMLAQPGPGVAESANASSLERARCGVRELQQLVQAYRRRFLGGRIGYAGDPDAIYAAVQARVQARLDSAR